jgi:hypothetical protein
MGKWVLFTVSTMVGVLLLSFALMNLEDANLISDSPFIFGVLLGLEMLLGLILMFVFKFIDPKPLKNLFLSRS